MVILQQIVWASHFANKPSRNFSLLVVLGHTQCHALVLDITVFNMSNIKYQRINKIIESDTEYFLPSGGENCHPDVAHKIKKG